MDSLTHVVMGASMQAALLGRVQGRKALLYGAVLATLPDLDVLIPYPDPVSLMTHHRGVTHSVFVLTALAAVLVWLIRKRWPAAPYSAGRLFLTVWLVLIAHPIVDALTTYGTQIFWPLPVHPVSVSSIFIIDPVFTLPLVLAFVASLVWGEGARRIRSVALIFCTVYLGFTLAAKMVAERHVRSAMTRQGIPVSAMFSAPMPLNSLLWRVIVRTSDGDYYETITSLFDRSPPEQLRHSLNQPLSKILSNAPLHARLNWFTNGWLRYDAIGSDLVVTDLRLGMPGYHFFRFVMAHQDYAGNWQTVVPRFWPNARGGWPELKQILYRIVEAQPPLPLERWSFRNTVPNVAD
jgi:inner membrane protein